MAKAKNKNQSKKFHNSRARVRLSHLSRVKKRDQHIFRAAKNTTFTVIILTTLVMILITLFASFINPERIIKHKIESIATDYYESYFYPEIVTNNVKTPSEIFEKYTTTGFTLVSFQQLLLFDGEKHADSVAAISEYCELDSSYVKFYPDSPFYKTDYHVEYHYSCAF